MLTSTEWMGLFLALIAAFQAVMVEFMRRMNNNQNELKNGLLNAAEEKALLRLKLELASPQSPPAEKPLPVVPKTQYQQYRDRPSS